MNKLEKELNNLIMKEDAQAVIDMLEADTNHEINVQAEGDYFLLTALIKKNIEIMRILIEFGANIRFKDDYVLVRALMLQDTRLIDFALESGCDPERIREHGYKYDRDLKRLSLLPPEFISLNRHNGGEQWRNIKEIINSSKAN